MNGKGLCITFTKQPAAMPCARCQDMTVPESTGFYLAEMTVAGGIVCRICAAFDDPGPLATLDRMTALERAVAERHVQAEIGE